MKFCGIYIIKNKINKLCYIGQSVDIYCRWTAHKQAAKNIENQSSHTKIHKAMRELGIDNFYIEILELCEYNKLDEKEIYWISFYNTYHYGYNMTPGGQGNIGESNGRALLTREIVEDIRMAYASHIPFREVYDKYKGKISKRGLQKVWSFETWIYIMPEVYTEENKEWHRTKAKGFQQTNLNNYQKQFDINKINRIKNLRQQGYSYRKIAEELNCSYTTVRKYCLFEINQNPINGIQLKNIETGLIFNSFTQAAKWSQCDRHTISRNINTQKSAGIVPSTNEPAHWISI